MLWDTCKLLGEAARFGLGMARMAAWNWLGRLTAAAYDETARWALDTPISKALRWGCVTVRNLYDRLDQRTWIAVPRVARLRDDDCGCEE